MFGKLTIGSLLLASGFGHLVPCNSSFDVMLLQDTTLSFTDGLKNIYPQIKDLVEFGLKINPDGRFGLSTFRDKPISPVGDKEDYCFNLVVPFTSDHSVLEHAYETLTAGGGGDFPQGHYQGLLASLQLLACEWRAIGTQPGEVGARIVIVLTDSIPHNADDIIEGFPHLPPNDGIVTQDNTQIDCVFKGYPTLDQVLATVKGNHHQYVGFVTPDDNKEVVDTWSYINEEILHQPKVFYQHINKDAKDFTGAVLKIVEAVQHYVCEVDAMTTPTPATSPMSTKPETSANTTPYDTTGSITTTTTTTEAPTTEVSTTPTTETTATTTPTHTTVATHSTTPTHSGTTNPCPKPCPCPCPHPCPHNCCKDEVQLKIVGHPVHVDMDIEYDLKH